MKLSLEMPPRDLLGWTGQFVLLHHEVPAGAARGSHWDLMIESVGGLMTWALPQEPTADADYSSTSGQGRAQRLPDHRLAYLTFEGPLGGQRGSVVRCDAGTHCTYRDEAGRWVIAVRGDRLNGQFILAPPAADGSCDWSWRRGSTPGRG